MNKEFEMKESLDFAISGAEIEIADKSVQMALDAGASAVMVSLDKAKTEIYALLDGEIDNIRQTGDRSLTFNIYADGKYGTFSTNRFEEESLRDFLCKAVETVRMLVADPFRGLPDKKDLATDAVNGDEMGLCWYGYDSVTREEKLEMARRVSVFGEFSTPSSDRNWRVVSEEVEYNNTLSDTYLTSSDGCRCRQTETSFEVSSQVTVEDNDGNKYSGLWWDYGVSPEKVLTSECGRKAVEMAVMQIAPVNADKGKYTMVVSRLVSGRLLQPVLNALSSLSVYQKSSFLVDALGKPVFSKGLNVMDMPLEKGKSGAILFETDGRACRNREIISDGVVKENFTSIYMSRKLGIPPTSSCPNRPVLLPFVSEELLGWERGGELGVERSGGHCGVSGDGLDGSGLGGDCGGVSGAGLGAVSGGGRGVERGVVNGGERGVELGAASDDGRGVDRGEMSGDGFGAVNSGKRGVELGVASGDGRGVERCETSGSGLGGDCGEVSGAGFGAVNGCGRGVELGAVNGADRGLKADPFVNEIAQKDILDLCGSGILVTDFNGGNCNSATGDFSYGVSGFLFENGKITSPIDSMLITGNMTDLWSNLLAAGSDPVPGMSRQVPTLAFRDVTFNA